MARDTAVLVQKRSREEPVAQLPKTLVEKIIASMPYPHILKARQLCREWLSRFHQVVDISKWPEYGPVVFDDKELFVLDQKSDVWHRQPLLEPLAYGHGKGPKLFIASGGFLFCALVGFVGEERYLLVTNLLTRKSTKISCPERMLQCIPVLCRSGCQGCPSRIWRRDGELAENPPTIIAIGPDHFKIVLYEVEVHFDTSDHYLRTYEYSSSSKMWMDRLVLLDDFDFGPDPFVTNGVYFRGRIYIIEERPRPVVNGGTYMIMTLYRINPEEGTWIRTPEIHLERNHAMAQARPLAVSASRLFVGVVVDIYIDRMSDKLSGKEARVYEVEQASFTLVEISRSPRDFEWEMDEEATIVASNFAVYFFGYRRLISFHIPSNRWRSHAPVPGMGKCYKFCSCHFRHCVALQPGGNGLLTP